ncbi:MAG: hypothetical protein E5Y88_17330 [Mesorhizobium sp.]|nr:hypothetical protein EOC94_14180 [Mesorhizobium sp. M6A.T.Ce.TU.016.01.1.1]RWQ38145.1 MAG: hypothetical protein EOS20_09865 [Mesorhizobium sp.]TIL24466.1 MAG: hypothetical protein E5Y88_17330 [Mesorhizobium sp.]
MRGAPAWHRQRSVQHPSSVSALRADPPSPTRGEGRGDATIPRRHLPRPCGLPPASVAAPGTRPIAGRPARR